MNSLIVSELNRVITRNIHGYGGNTMKRRRFFNYVGLVFTIFLIFLTGCDALQTAPPPTAEPQVLEDYTPIVSATGVVVPVRKSTLSMSTSGIISNLAVAENDQVSAGDLLVQLKGAEYLNAAIASAEFELASAQFDLEQLYKDTDLLAAESYQAVVRGRQEVKDAARYLNNLGKPPSQGDIDQAKANMLLAKIALDKAQDDFEPYEKKKEDNKIRAALFSKLADAEKLYENAVRRVNNLGGAASELDIEEAEADLALAELQLQLAERDYEIYKAGPDPDDVRITQERIINAEAQLTAAKAAQEDLNLSAPFDGTVSNMYVNQNEWISAGTPVLQLADLDRLQIETTDLSEIDVARIEVGSPAIVTFDAIPDVEVIGSIVRIAPKSDEGAGVNYKVVIESEDIPEKILWGMTAFVDIEVE